MGPISKFHRYLTDSDYRFQVNLYLGLSKLMTDEQYLKEKFKMKMGYDLDLDHPRTFNEKLQWLKIHDHNPLYPTMVDKYEAKKYVADIIGEEYIIPTLGVWNNFDEIDFNTFPDKFVLKCTHDSGGIVICKDKKTFDIQSAKEIINKSLKRNYYYVGREWPYKNVKPRIIAEPYLTDESGTELKDYKIFNFNGVSKIIQVDFDRFVQHKRNLYTCKWDYIEMSIEYPSDSTRLFEKPKALPLMLDLAAKLSLSFPHVRTDFYSIGEKILFGELTFYHGSGFERFIPEEWDYTLGSWIDLPK